MQLWTAFTFIMGPSWILVWMVWLALVSSGTGDLLGNSCVLRNGTSNVTAAGLLSKCDSGANGTQVSFIQFDNCDFAETLPPLLEAFPNLLTIDASNTKVTLIENTTFALGKSLVTLQLFNNSIADLGGNIFEKLNGLKDLNLASNKINHTDDHAFYGLNSLSMLDLSMNEIESLPEGLFHPLTSVHTIRLDGNNIEIIDKDTFKMNRVLHTIYLHNNKIYLIDPDSFSATRSLRTIDVSDNPLKNAHFLRHTAGLKDIVISNTLVTEIDIPSTATKVQANDNKISQVMIMTDATKGGTKLTLNLANNTLNALGQISQLHQLETLFLSHNNLTEIDFNEFSNMTILHQLALDNNNFMGLNTTNVKKILPKLEIIHLSLSKWDPAEAKRIVDEFTAQNIYVMNETVLVNPQVGENYHDLMQPVLPEPLPETPLSDAANTKTVISDANMKQITDQLNKTEEQLHHHIEKYEKLRDKVRYFVIFAFCLIASLVAFVVYYKNLLYRIRWDRLPVPNWLRTNSHGILDESNDQPGPEQPEERIEPNGLGTANNHNGRNGGTNSYDRSNAQLIVNMEEDESRL